jgi:hypothetical protein
VVPSQEQNVPITDVHATPNSQCHGVPHPGDPTHVPPPHSALDVQGIKGGGPPSGVSHSPA